MLPKPQSVMRQATATTQGGNTCPVPTAISADG